MIKYREKLLSPFNNVDYGRFRLGLGLVLRPDQTRTRVDESWQLRIVTDVQECGF